MAASTAGGKVLFRSDAQLGNPAAPAGDGFVSCPRKSSSRGGNATSKAGHADFVLSENSEWAKVLKGS